MQKTIAAQKDEIAKKDDSAKQNAGVLKQHEQKIAEMTAMLQTARERERTVRSQALDEGAARGYKKGYGVGRAEPTRTNAKREGAEEALENAHKKMGKMEMEMEALTENMETLTENAENDQIKLDVMTAKNGGGGSVFRFLPSSTAEGFYYLEARSVMDQDKFVCVVKDENVDFPRQRALLGVFSSRSSSVSLPFW
jgi:hypothetical protein